jgi:hypothetical protein
MRHLIYNLTILLLLSLSNFSYGQPVGSVIEIDQYSRGYTTSTPSVFGGDFSVETWVYLRGESCPNNYGAGNSSQPGHNSNDVFVSVADHKNTNGDNLKGFELGIQSSDAKRVGPSSSQTNSEDKFYFVVGNGSNSGTTIIYSNFTNSAWKNTTNGYYSYNNAGIPKCSQWYHVAGVYDHSAQQIKLYVNGSLQGTSSTSGKSPTSSPYSGLALGSEATGSNGDKTSKTGNQSGFLDGGLDNVAIWNTDKSSTYATNHNRTISTSASGLKTYYDFEQTNTTPSSATSSGTTVQDKKGSVNPLLYDTQNSNHNNCGNKNKQNCRYSCGGGNNCRNSGGGGMRYLAYSTVPVTLVSFIARKLPNSSVQLEWTTASEINNSHFTVEKSFDAVDWQIVEEISGAGNSTSVNHYQTIDNNPLPGISYYRLKQTDFDGTFEYSPIQSVVEDRLTYQLKISPNPIENILRINIPLNANQSIAIFDSRGTNLTLMTDVIEQREQYSLLDVSKLRSGIYFLRTGYQTLKFAKK